jgi:hypothetical protein
LWLALICGLVTCSLLGKRWPLSLFLVWTLGEAAATILACWYAPSLGEPPSLRSNRYMLLVGVISLLGGTLVLCQAPRSAAGWRFVLMLLASLLILIAACFVHTDPGDAQALLMGLATLRFVLLAYAGYHWLPSDATKTGEEQPSPATV